MEIFVEEIATTPNSTASQMFINNRPFCFVIEDGHRDTKIPGETRIPAGRYRIVKRTHGGFFARYRQKFGHKFSIEIKDVPNYSDILAHIGNKPKDTRGCLLTVSGIQLDAMRDFFGVKSTEAYLAFYKVVEAAFDRGEEVWLEISRRPVVSL